MRTILVVFSVCASIVFLSACDNGDEGKNVPRTVPPALRGAVALPEAAPAETDKKLIHGKGPIYWI